MSRGFVRLVTVLGVLWLIPSGASAATITFENFDNLR